jgi:hypothetical protein
VLSRVVAITECFIYFPDLPGAAPVMVRWLGARGVIYFALDWHSTPGLACGTAGHEKLPEEVERSQVEALCNKKWLASW